MHGGYLWDLDLMAAGEIPDAEWEYADEELVETPLLLPGATRGDDGELCDVRLASGESDLLRGMRRLLGDGRLLNDGY